MFGAEIALGRSRACWGLGDPRAPTGPLFLPAPFGGIGRR
jgi:hypothetical protein